jgi:hypothetical protein
MTGKDNESAPFNRRGPEITDARECNHTNNRFIPLAYLVSKRSTDTDVIALPCSVPISENGWRSHYQERQTL